MMKFNTLVYHFRQSLNGFKRSGIMAMATISTVAASLMILGAFLLFHGNLNLLLQNLQGQLKVNFYLKDGASEREISEFIQGLKQEPVVRDFEIISKADALDLLRKDLGEDSVLLDNLSRNPLPNTITVTLHPTEEIRAFREKYAANPMIESSSSGKDWVEQILNLIHLAKVSGTFIVVFLGLASLFIISNTIRLTVFARRHEIEIMRLVGATNWFIRSPFLMEGVLQGIAGALIATLFLAFGYGLLQDRLLMFFPELKLLSSQADLIQLYLKLFFLGIALGLLGSLLSLRKFLV